MPGLRKDIYRNQRRGGLPLADEQGKSFVDLAVAGKLIQQVAGHQTQPASLLAQKLTERELEVLRLLAKGMTNAEIASALYLSEGTVRNHVSAILEKLGVSDRTQAAVIAIQHEP